MHWTKRSGIYHVYMHVEAFVDIISQANSDDLDLSATYGGYLKHHLHQKMLERKWSCKIQ